jgi:hypothetical protein
MTKFITISVVLVLAVLFEEAIALKCWRCSSDSSTTAFCADPFDPSLIQNENQRRWAYVECSVPTTPYIPNQTPQKALCKKVKQLLNNKEVVSRSCVIEDFNTQPKYCATDSILSFAKTEFCETCSTDGCNSAGSFTPVAILIVTCVAVAKFLSL